MSEVEDLRTQNRIRADSRLLIENEVLENHSSIIKIYCRFRPFIKFELTNDADRKAQCSVAFHKLGKNALLKHGVAKPIKFDFDRVFQPSSTQENVYEVVGAPTVEEMTNESNNHVIISCGGSLSGKTYVLLGTNTSWDEVDTVHSNDGLLIRCCRAIFEYISEASEKEEFTIRITINKVAKDKIIDLISGNNEECYYVNSVSCIGTLLEQAQRSLDPEESATLCYALTLSRTIVSSNHKTTSTLCFIDLNSNDFENLDTILETRVGESTPEISGIRHYLNDTMLGNYNVRLIGNCSPHISAVVQTQKTMEIITSVPLKKQNATNKVLDHDNKMGSPKNTSNEREEQRELLHSSFQTVSKVLCDLKHEQSQMKSYWKDTILQTQDKIIDDFSSVFVDREQKFLDDVSSLNIKQSDLQERYDSLLAEKEELEIQLKSVKTQLENLNVKVRDMNSIQERCWAAEAEAHRVLEEKTDLEIILKMKNEELETFAMQVKESENTIQTSKASCSDLEVARAALEDLEKSYQKLQIEHDKLLMLSSEDNSQRNYEEKISKLEQEIEQLKTQNVKYAPVGVELDEVNGDGVLETDPNQELMKINTEKETLQLQLDNELAEKEMLQEELVNVKALCDIHGDQFNQLSEQLSILSDREKSYSQSLEDLILQLRKKESDLSIAAERSNTLELELSNSKTEIDNLQARLMEISKENALHEETSTINHTCDKILPDQVEESGNCITQQSETTEETSNIIVKHEKEIEKLQNITSSLESENFDLKNKMEELQIKLTQSALKNAQDASTIMEQFDKIVKLEEQLTEGNPSVHESSTKLVNLQNTLEESLNQLEKSKLALNEKLEEINVLRNDLQIVSQEKETIQQANYSLQEELTLLLENKTEYEEERKRYVEDFRSVKLQVNTLTDANYLKDDLIREFKEKVDMMEGNVTHLQGVIDMLTQEKVAIENAKLLEIQRLESDLRSRETDINQKVSQLENELTVLNQEKQELISINEELHGRSSLLEEQLAEVVENLRRNDKKEIEEERLNSLLEQIEQLNNYNSDTQLHFSTVIEEKNSLRKEVELITEQKNKAVLMNEDLQTRLNQIEQFCRVLENKVTDLQLQLESARSEKEEIIKKLDSINNENNRPKLEQENEIVVQEQKLQENMSNISTKDVAYESDDAQPILSLRTQIEEKQLLETELLTLKNTMLAKDELIQELHETIDLIRTEKTEIDIANKKLQDYERSKLEINNLKLEVEGYQDEEQKMRMCLNDLEEERSNLEQKLEQALLLLQDTNEIDKYLEEIKQLRNEKDDLSNQNTELLEKISAANLEIDRLANKCRLKEVMIEEAEKRNEKLSKEIQLLEERFDNIQEELADARRELTLKSDLLNVLEQERSPNSKESFFNQGEQSSDTTTCGNVVSKREDGNQGESLSILETSQNDSTIVEDLQSAIADMKKENESLREEVALLRSRSESSVAVYQEMESLKNAYDKLREQCELMTPLDQEASIIHHLPSHERLLDYIRKLVCHIEKMKQEKLQYESLLIVKDRENRLMKNKNEQKDTLISFLYNQISTTASAKSNQAEKMKIEIDQLMDIINRSKRNLTQPRTSKQRHTAKEPLSNEE